MGASPAQALLARAARLLHQALPQQRVVARPLVPPQLAPLCPGAAPAAISAPSISSVPEPHIGSYQRAARRVASSGQRARSSIAAARFSFSGAAPVAPR